MAKYELFVRPSVKKDVKDIPMEDLQKITERIAARCDDPRPMGSIKLSGQNYYRVRQGDYRIIYEIQDALLIVLVVRIGHRREIYR